MIVAAVAVDLTTDFAARPPGAVDGSTAIPCPIRKEGPHETRLSYIDVRRALLFPAGPDAHHEGVESQSWIGGVEWMIAECANSIRRLLSRSSGVVRARNKAVRNPRLTRWVASCAFAACTSGLETYNGPRYWSRAAGRCLPLWLCKTPLTQRSPAGERVNLKRQHP